MSGLPSHSKGQKLQSLPQLSAAYFDVFKRVVDTSTPYRTNITYNTSNGSRWCMVILTALHDGLVANYVDITESKQIEHDYIKKANELDTIFHASLSAVYSAEVLRDKKGKINDIRFIRVNDCFLRLRNTTESEVIGKKLMEFFPSARETGFMLFVERVITTGEPVKDELYYKELDEWYEFSMVKLDENKICVTYNDITQQKRNLLQIERQKLMLDNILRYSSTGISVTEVVRNEEGALITWKTILANEAAANFLGLSLEELLQKTTEEIAPDLVVSPTARAAVATLETGEPFVHQIYISSVSRWLEIRVSKLDNDHLINILTDINGSKEAQIELETLATRLKTVFTEAQAGMFIFHPEKNDQGEVFDFRFVLVNPVLASYVNQIPEMLEGDLGSNWFPGYLHNGVFDMYKETYLTGITSRKEVHYNIDGLDIYLDLQSVKMGEDVLVTFTDHTPLRQAQHLLEKSIEELKRSNANLEEFTRAASHDLKEPVRKIHFFIDLFRLQLSDKFNADQQQMFKRLQNAAQRMLLLVDDLLDYSYVTIDSAEKEEIDLNKKIRLVLEDLELPIKEKNATVAVKNLPTVKGYRRQLLQLFQNLISNALKYSREDVPPEITISSTPVTGHSSRLPLPPEDLNREFYSIEVADNGIGFDQEQAENIFTVFTRLHTNSEYAGTGISPPVENLVKGQPLRSYYR
jgi:signal transduction histidine kinase